MARRGTERSFVGIINVLVLFEEKWQTNDSLCVKEQRTHAGEFREENARVGVEQLFYKDTSKNGSNWNVLSYRTLPALPQGKSMQEERGRLKKKGYNGNSRIFSFIVLVSQVLVPQKRGVRAVSCVCVVRWLLLVCSRS